MNSPAQPVNTPTSPPSESPVTPNNRLPLIVGAGSLLLFVILVAAIMLSRSVPEPTPVVDVPTPPIAEETSQTIVLEPMLVTNPDGTNSLELILNPVGPSVEMTTLSILLNITGDSAQNPGVEGEVELGERLIIDDWTFPISRTEVVGNSLVTKIAALRIATDVYQLSDPITIATIPLPNTQDMSLLNLGLDQQESKFFDSQAVEHRFELSQESITLN